MRARVTLATVFAGVAWAASASAGNDDEMLVGNRASMTGGAVSATVSDASSIWYNPAGLGGDSRDKIDVSATAYSLLLTRYPRRRRGSANFSSKCLRRLRLNLTRAPSDRTSVQSPRKSGWISRTRSRFTIAERWTRTNLS